MYHIVYFSYICVICYIEYKILYIIFYLCTTFIIFYYI